MKDLTRGILRENPIFVTLIGLCPSLAITTHVVNAVGLGAAVIVVMVLSSLTAALIGDSIPPKFRGPIFIAVIAVFVTLVDLIMRSYLPVLSDRLGIFVPLIVVNCLILARADAFARKTSAGRATLDALGMGVGFTLALVLIALIREILGAGTITLFPVGSFSGVVRAGRLADEPIRVIGLSAGALFVVGYLKALVNWVGIRRRGEDSRAHRGVREEDL
jgi:electron transport complex protein RnfE